MTREEAIRLHREMWQLVADACRKKGSTPLKHLDVADVEASVIRKMLFKMGERYISQEILRITSLLHQRLEDIFELLKSHFS